MKVESLAESLLKKNSSLIATSINEDFSIFGYDISIKELKDNGYTDFILRIKKGNIHKSQIFSNPNSLRKAVQSFQASQQRADQYFNALEQD